MLIYARGRCTVISRQRVHATAANLRLQPCWSVRCGDPPADRPHARSVQVLSGQKVIEVEGGKIPVRLEVQHLSFSAHADAKGIMQLIKQCDAKAVVLVHGEKKKMGFLSNKIKKELGVDCFFPANGALPPRYPPPTGCGNEMPESSPRAPIGRYPVGFCPRFLLLGENIEIQTASSIPIKMSKAVMKRAGDAPEARQLRHFGRSFLTHFSALMSARVYALLGPMLIGC